MTPENETNRVAPVSKEPGDKGGWANTPSIPITDQRQSKGPWTNVPSEKPYGRRTRLVRENEIKCEGPGCGNYIRPGWVEPRQKRFFCSEPCDWRFYNRRHLIGTCEHCGGPIMGTPGRAAQRKHCSRTCWLASCAAETLGLTGPLRAGIEEYLEGPARNRYREGTLPTVKVSLWHFAAFAHGEEGISRWEDVKPATITKFIAKQRAAGKTSGNCVGHLSTLFRTFQAEGKITSSPVIPYIHSQRGNKCSPRPFSEPQLEKLWSLVENSDNTVLKLAFSLGLECGLRVGEVCNLRIEDIDTRAQTAFVRLPTKNMRTRIVPYSWRVVHYLDVWLKERNARCKHDHLLHTVQLATFRTSGLDLQFRHFFRAHGISDSSFAYHALRHTWATRLLNNGMDLAVLKELGGWVSLKGLERYVLVLDSTLQRQYQEAYKKLQEKEEQGAETVISLVDFANMHKEETGTQADSEA